MAPPDFSGRGEYEINVKGHLDEQWSYWFEEGKTAVTLFVTTS
jgi:antitoxin component YwqK of YwqJK toxin-antitoxin module